MSVRTIITIEVPVDRDDSLLDVIAAQAMEAAAARGMDALVVSETTATPSEPRRPCDWSDCATTCPDCGCCGESWLEGCPCSSPDCGCYQDRHDAG